MTRLTLADVQALAGFTDGPWIAHIYAAQDAAVAVAEDDPDKHDHPLALIVGQTDARDAPLLAAAPDLHADLLTLHGVVADIATAIGTPANVDPLADLPGLVLMVQAMAQRAESRDIRLVAAEGQAAAAVAEVRALRETMADAVAAERMAAGTYIRERAPMLDYLSRAIEHGDHIDDDAPPLPSLRMVLALRDELHRQIKALEAENARLTSQNETYAGAMLALGAL
jgi:hypothetical protein